MEIKQNISLAQFTTFKTGGTADFFCAVKNVEELKKAVAFAEEKKLPIFILGNGSNLLISDAGFRGLVLKMEIGGTEIKKPFDHIDIFEASAGAGENWDKFVRQIVMKHLGGLENLSGIPGTVGASVVQNIGAYGAEAGNAVSSVEVFDIEAKKIKKMKREECLFGYRDSIFKHSAGKRFIITRVNFLLSKNSPLDTNYKDIRAYLEENPQKMLTPKILRRIILIIRAGKMPDLEKFGTAGSFFKNPMVSAEKFAELSAKYPDLPKYPPAKGGSMKVSLAWILDNVCGLKGFRKGNVGLYEKQPLVLVNFGGAAAKEISNFADKIAALAKEKVGLEIEREAEMIGG